MPEQSYDVSPTVLEQRRQLTTFKPPENIEKFREKLLDGITFPDGITPKSELEHEDLQNLANGTLRLINLCIQRGYDTVFFLDKSTRPAVWLFRDVWNKLYPGVPYPKIRYINVGRNQTDMEDLSDEQRETTIKELQAKYHADKFHPQHILVADEFSYTGESTYRAAAIMKGVFTEATVEKTGIFEKIPPAWKYKQDISDFLHVQEAPDPRKKAEIEQGIKRIWTANDYVVQRAPVGEKNKLTSRIFREELRNLASIIANQILTNKNSKTSDIVELLLPQRGSHYMQNVSTHHPASKFAEQISNKSF